MDDREIAIAAAKKRMAAFRLRQAPATAPSIDVVLPVKHHARSHSRNNSITAFPPTTMNSATPADDPLDTVASVPSSPSPRSRPNSHHRRRSSVSTRRESAEMMGVALPPEIPSEIADDPIELRRLALWALEGKDRTSNAFIGSFTKVEIPELNTPHEGNFDAIQQPKPVPTLSTFGIGNSLAGKRDSFGKLLMSASNSLKDQLHTLVEEEEEEEEETKEEKYTEPTPPPSEYSDSFRDEPSPFRTESPSYDEVTRPYATSRHRPTNLTLRPLSLTPESLPISRTEGLPTPSPTPSPRGGLRALTLAPSPSPAPSHSSTSSVSSAASRRQSMSVSPSQQPVEPAQRRMSVGSTPNPPIPTRKSSISYKRAPSGDYPAGYLPTPGPTPTSPLPPRLHSVQTSGPDMPSLSRMAADLERPLSPTQQAFLVRSHTSLLCRISDLEKAIADGGGRLPPGAGVPVTGFGLDTLPSRSPSHERPTSIASASSLTSRSESIDSAPSDEMLHLVADLKAERDELMRESAGWRSRTTDLERQVGTLTRRVEAERREGWVIRERLGVVEVEKKRVREEVERVRLELRGLEKTLEAEVEVRTRAEAARDAEYARRDAAEQEVEVLRSETAQLRARAEQADADLQSLLVTPKVDVRVQMPVRHLNSVDSCASGSMTDVEEYVPFGLRTLKLNAVAEEEERDLPRDVTSADGSGSEMDEDEDELAHYEDDDGLDDDMIFSDDQTSSSFGSVARSNSHLMRLDLAAVAPVPALASAHAKTGSMERGWSFPAQPSSAHRVVPKVDHFFECLDGLDESDVEHDGVLPTYDSKTSKQFWGAAAQAEDDDEMPPFVLPTQPSPPRKEKEWKELEAVKLEIVKEVMEDDESISFRFPVRTEQIVDAVDAIAGDPVTPRQKAGSAFTGTPTKIHKARRMSKDLTIPGFKPYSGSVPVLKPPPPPRRATSPGNLSPATTPKAKTPEPVSFSPPTQIPQPSRSSPSSPPSRPRASLPGPTLIPRLSPSPKPSTTIRAPTKPSSMTSATKTATPSAKTLTPPVFMPQPRLSDKPVTRSSIPPPSTEPRVLTRLTLPQTDAAPRTQGLTAKLSQGITSLWSPWSASAPVLPEREAARRAHEYVGKELQLERLRVRLGREGASAAPGATCAGCRDEMFQI